jgi:hypothetical protein
LSLLIGSYKTTSLIRLYGTPLAALAARFGQQGVMPRPNGSGRATMATSASDRRPAAAELRMLAGRYLYFGELMLGLEAAAADGGPRAGPGSAGSRGPLSP